MEKFVTLDGVAAPMRFSNIDTDKILPVHWLKTTTKTGLGKGIFEEDRFFEDGRENDDFVLNKPLYRNARIIIAEDNFGCGSSREHAPWALLDFGIRCVISTSFGDIFYMNCLKNGLLPIRVSEDELHVLLDDAEDGACSLHVDLDAQKIRREGGEEISFEIDGFFKHCLMNGIDEIGHTIQSMEQITAYQSKIRKTRPWV